MDTLQFLYGTKVGRVLLRPLISRPVSVISGWLLDSRASRALIQPFVKSNGICTDDYELDGIKCFNDFFCRKIKKELRPIEMDDSALIAPCDGLLTVHKVSKGDVIGVKQSRFTISSLLRDKELAKSFEDGYCMVFRLCVNHYHRYIYFDSGHKYKNRKINGVFHTVRPVALEKYPVFVENSREYAVIDTKNFGRCVQMEVGAMLVGHIANESQDSCMVKRGMEKGHFEYGGSTIIVLLPKDAVQLNSAVKNAMQQHVELPVQMGEVLGCRK